MIVTWVATTSSLCGKWCTGLQAYTVCILMYVKFKQRDIVLYYPECDLNIINCPWRVLIGCSVNPRWVLITASISSTLLKQHPLSFSFNLGSIHGSRGQVWTVRRVRDSLDDPYDFWMFVKLKKFRCFEDVEEMEAVITVLDNFTLRTCKRAFKKYLEHKRECSWESPVHNHCL